MLGAIEFAQGLHTSEPGRDMDSHSNVPEKDRRKIKIKLRQGCIYF